MAAGTRSVVVRFSGDTKDLQRAGRDGEQAMGRWQTAFRGLNRVASGVLLGLGASIAGAVTQMSRAGDEIATTADQVGVGVESLQEMRFWAEEAGVAQSDLERAVGRLNQRIGDGEEGANQYVDAIHNLGVETQNANGQVRETEDVMRDTIGALRDIEDPSQRAAAAGEIFGTRLGRQLQPALSDTSMSLDEATEKAHEMGAVMDEDAVDQSVNFQAAVDDLKTVGAGLIQEFATPFLEILSEDVLPVIRDDVVPQLQRFAEFVRENQGLVLAVAGALGGLAAAIKAISVVMRVVTVVQWAWNVAVAANPIGLIIAAIVALIAIIWLLVANWDTVLQWLSNAWEWIKGVAVAVWEEIRDFFVDLWNGITDLISQAIDRVKNIFLSFHPLGIIIDNWGAITGWIGDQWENVTGLVRDAVDNIKGFFSGMWDGVTEGLKSAINGAIRLLNGGIRGVNELIGGANSVPGVDIPRLPTIPLLAEGGIATGPTLAMIGEGVNDEAILPLPRGMDPEELLAGGPSEGRFEGELVLDSGEFMGRVHGVMRDRDRQTKRRVLARTGAAA